MHGYQGSVGFASIVGSCAAHTALPCCSAEAFVWATLEQSACRTKVFCPVLAPATGRHWKHGGRSLGQCALKAEAAS